MFLRMLIDRFFFSSSSLSLSRLPSCHKQGQLIFSSICTSLSISWRYCRCCYSSSSTSSYKMWLPWEGRGGKKDFAFFVKVKRTYFLNINLPSFARASKSDLLVGSTYHRATNARKENFERGSACCVQTGKKNMKKTKTKKHRWKRVSRECREENKWCCLPEWYRMAK